MLQRLTRWAWSKAIGFLLAESNHEALSPTLKIKREKVKELFADEIIEMYSGH